MIYKLIENPTDVLPGFNFKIPTMIRDVDSTLLDPRKTWKEASAYTAKANTLIDSFVENFKQFDVAKKIKDAGPQRV